MIFFYRHTKKINLKVGQEINLTLENSSNKERKITSLLIPLSKTHKMHIKKNVEILDNNEEKRLRILESIETESLLRSCQ